VNTLCGVKTLIIMIQSENTLGSLQSRLARIDLVGLGANYCHHLPGVGDLDAFVNSNTVRIVILDANSFASTTYNPNG